MIGAVLANECAKKLREVQCWDDSKCEISPEGQPWASSGDFFVGLFPSDDENTNPLVTNFCFPTEHAFVARISRRVRGTPQDRLHKIYVEETKALCRLANTVRQTLIDNRETIRASVNTELVDDGLETDIQLIRPFSWLSTESSITERDGAWFRSKQGDSWDTFNVAGYSIDVNFGLAAGIVVSAQ
jgi:hypothetical protein